MNLGTMIPNTTNSVNKDYAPYEIALAMKELGFDIWCYGYYNIDKYVVSHSEKPLTTCNYNMEPEDDDGWSPVSAPTFQQAFDWFEDEQNIYVARTVDTSVNEVLDFTYYLKSWRFPPIEIEFEEPYDCFDRHKSRIACLNKMIEIVKSTQ